MLGAVADILSRRGTEGWLVGGSVRDRLLGRFSPDVDIVVADEASAVAEQVAAALHLPWFSLSERYPTYRVVGANGHIDVAAVRGGSIVADLGQRDFTVNAMAVPVVAVADDGAGSDRFAEALGAGVLLDPFGGATHLSEMRLLAVSDHIFTDDPLRLMRASRFCHTLGLRLDDGLASLVREQAPRLAAAAAERVMNEMCLTLACGRASAAVRLWDELGLLAVVLPELAPPDGGAAAARAGVAPGAATADRLAATLALLDRLDEMLERPEQVFQETAGFLIDRSAEPIDGAVTRSVALRLAGLASSLDTGQVRAVGRRLKVSSTLASLLVTVARCARAEGFAGLLPDAGHTGRAAVLFFWQAAPWEPEVVLLTFARAEGSEGEARRMMALAAGRAQGGLAPCPVDGEVLKRELGMESGPPLGRALREARLAWESGEATTLAELLAAARQALPKT